MVPVPKVSVVIPTRNRPVPLRNAIISVLAQTLSDLEVIVVVDGENGSETSALIASFGDGRLRCIALPKSVGGAEARSPLAHPVRTHIANADAIRMRG